MTKTRNIVKEEGGEPFAVHTHIILKNFWEYYLEKPDKDGNAFGLVLGGNNGGYDEWGTVYMEEIKPYIATIARGNELEHIMPPVGYRWKGETE